MKLLERIAPEDPDADFDERGFYERLSDADQHRGENPNTLWSTFNPKTHETKPYWELTSTWQFTRFSLGVEYQNESASMWTEGHRWFLLSLGVYTLCLTRMLPKLPRIVPVPPRIGGAHRER